MSEISHLKSQSPEVLVKKIEHVMSTHKQGTIGDVEKLFKKCESIKIRIFIFFIFLVGDRGLEPLTFSV